MLGERSTDPHDKDDKRDGEGKKQVCVTRLLYCNPLDDDCFLRDG